MFKKIFCFGILFIMVFSLAACNQGLAAYKEDAKRQIESYANAKGEENYIPENWAAVLAAAEAGKTAIDAAENKADVDSAVATTKSEIDDIEFELSEELESRIKVDYLQEFGYELFLGDELLNNFYGIYNGAAVFFIAGEDCVIKTVTISGVEFSYNYSWTILVWKDGVFYNLENIEPIFETGILTQNDLEAIGVEHANAHEFLTEEESELNEELENRIKADYLQEFGYSFWYDRFYGIYNGTTVFFIAGEDCVIKTALRPFGGKPTYYHRGLCLCE